jgi:hypothetical protein
VKRYDFMGNGGDSKKPNSELPSDPHLLLYLFCAFLEHPQWMLHVDPYAHSSMQTGTNPLFLNTLPGNERYPEKHVAVLSSAPGPIGQASSTSIRPVLGQKAAVLSSGEVTSLTRSPGEFTLFTFRVIPG